MTRAPRFAMFPLPETEAGDVLAARSCADGLLIDAAASIHLLGQARLVLTAACLHLQARLGPPPDLADLHALLIKLASNERDLQSEMAESSLQLVQYVAREFPGESESGPTPVSLAIRTVKAKLHKKM